MRWSPRSGRAILPQGTPRRGAANRLLTRRRRLETGLAAVRRFALDQLPTVATEILENRDDAIRPMPWWSDGAVGDPPTIKRYFRASFLGSV